MALTAEIADLIERCTALRVPFAVVYMPREDTPKVYAGTADLEDNHDSESCDCFLIQKFSLGENSEPQRVVKCAHIPELLKRLETEKCRPHADISPNESGTHYDDYIRNATQIISSLKDTGYKTVLSRVIAVESEKSLTRVLDEFFCKFPDTLRFVYYTQTTGLWFGASPELLLDYDAHNHEIRTMALAGTRKVPDSPSPWDEKNLREHQYVTDYLLQGLKDAGLASEIYDSTPFTFGQIEHLCDRIRAYAATNPSRVLKNLSPTPALCGWPKKAAYEQIISTEQHDRHCYGGWISVRDDGNETVYVNLRCAFAEKSQKNPDVMLYNLFVGGGLTADSIPEEEWAETEAKSSVLFKILTTC